MDLDLESFVLGIGCTLVVQVVLALGVEWVYRRRRAQRRAGRVYPVGRRPYRPKPERSTR